MDQAKARQIVQSHGTILSEHVQTVPCKKTSEAPLTVQPATANLLACSLRRLPLVNGYKGFTQLSYWEGNVVTILNMKMVDMNAQTNKFRI